MQLSYKQKNGVAMGNWLAELKLHLQANALTRILLDQLTGVHHVRKHLAHMGNLFLVFDLFDILEHGLRAESRDQQNWASVQRFMFLCVNGGTKDKLATRIYLLICFLYVEIFCLLELSLWDRVWNASNVVNFLRNLVFLDSSFKIALH